MSRVIDNYMVVCDYGRSDMWVLCRNDDLIETLERMSDEDGEPEYRSLRDFVTCGNLDGGEYLKVTGDILGESIQVDAGRCVNELEDCFEDWFTDAEIDELLKGEECMYNALWDKVAAIAKQFAIDELESMIRRAKMLNVHNYNYQEFWS